MAEATDRLARRRPGARRPSTAAALEHTPPLSVRGLLEAGVHFGHQTRRWNPRMKPFLFGERNGVHILDLDQTLRALREGLDFLRETVAARRQGPVRRHQAAGAGVVAARGAALRASTT